MTTEDLRALTEQGPCVVMVSRDDMLRLLDEIEALHRELATVRAGMRADMYWMADDPERVEHDPRDHAVNDGMCPGEYFEVARAVSLGNAWAVVIPSGDDDDIDCEVAETEDDARRRANEIRAALASEQEPPR